MKIIVFTPIYQRHAILNVWLEGVKRLGKIADIQPVVIASTKEDIAWVERQKDIKLVVASNNPLSDKQNKGLWAIRDMEWDYICQISSDLLLTDEGFRELTKEPTDVMGFTQAYFIDTIWDRAILFKKKSGHKTIGACRMISRKVIAGLNYKLWSDGLNRGLDADSQSRMGDVDFRVIDKPLVVGLKSKQQITPFKRLLHKNEEVSVWEAVSGLSEQEIELIKYL